MSHDAIVRDMAIGEAVIVATDKRFIPWGSRTMHGTEFTEGIVVANFQPGGLAVIFQILRLLADRTVGEEAVVFAHFGRAQDRHMVLQPATCANFHIRTNNAIGADCDIRTDAG